MDRILRLLQRMMFFDEEGGAAAPVDDGGASAAPGVEPAAAPAAAAPAAEAEFPEVLSHALYGPPPEARGYERPPAVRQPPPAVDQGRGRAEPEIRDPGLPSRELWEDDFDKAQEQYAQHILAKGERDRRQREEQTVGELRREIAELRGGFSGDRQGRLLSTIQQADRALKADGYDPERGIIAANPHYKSNPKLKEAVDGLVAEYLNNAVRYAAQTGKVEEITKASSKESLESAMLLAMYHNGVDFSAFGIGRGRKPTASVTGGNLPGSQAQHDGGRKPLNAEQREVWKSVYPNMTEEQFRDHFKGKL